MLPKKISLLEKFGLCFLTMSFFGSTHRSFLLLSKLNKQSRAMLSKNYEGFLNCMIKNNACLLINNGDEAKLNLPCDLFNYNISLDSDGKLNAFIQMIGNILNKSGYYFNEKFMHSRMCVERILLHSDFVSKLYPCVESLKKVEAVECKMSNQKVKCINKAPLIDLIFLDLYYSSFFKNPFPHFIDKRISKSNFDPKLKHFKRIYCLNLKRFNNDEAVEYLTDSKDLDLHINEIESRINSSENLNAIL